LALKNITTAALFVEDNICSVSGGGEMTQIESVIPKDNYNLEIRLNNGNSINLNFISRLSTVRFSMLSDKAFFSSVTTDGTCIRWGTELEISFSEVFQLAQK
jgi:autonomous glycyl radical cofactor GrcA